MCREQRTQRNSSAFADNTGNSSEVSIVHPTKLLRIRIAEFLSLEVPQEEVVAVASHHIVRQQRNLSAAAGSIDHVRWHRIARGVAAEPFNDLQSLRHRRAKVR